MKNKGGSVPAEEQSDAVVDDGLDRDLDEFFDDVGEPEVADEDDVIESDEGDEPETDEADEAEEEAEEDEADDDDDDAEDDEEADEDVERVRVGMQKRIDKLTAKRKELEEKYEDAESQIAQLKDESESARLAALAGVDPDYMDGGDAKQVSKYDELKAIRDWCREHVETGYEGSGKPGDDAIEPEEIRKRLDLVQDEMIEIAPEAKRARDEARRRMKADLELGRKVRLKREEKRKAAKAAAGKKKKKSPAKVDQTATARPERSERSKKSEEIDRKVFEQGGRTSEALFDSMDGFFD